MRTCVIVICLLLFASGCVGLTLRETQPVRCAFCSFEQHETAYCAKCGMNLQPLYLASMEEMRDAQEKALEQLAQMPDNLSIAMWTNPVKAPVWVHGGLLRLERASGRRYVVGVSHVHEREDDAWEAAEEDGARQGGNYVLQRYTEASIVLRLRVPTVLYTHRVLMEVPAPVSARVRQ